MEGMEDADEGALVRGQTKINSPYPRPCCILTGSPLSLMWPLGPLLLPLYGSPRFDGTASYDPALVTDAGAPHRVVPGLFLFR